uniref:Transforming growth factor beta 1 induced transcript 1 n=1 Tax=Chelydra serpentina TaxID=8475 RepID=A0A8C3S861_CHESE
MPCGRDGHNLVSCVIPHVGGGEMGCDWCFVEHFGVMCGDGSGEAVQPCPVPIGAAWPGAVWHALRRSPLGHGVVRYRPGAVGCPSQHLISQPVPFQLPGVSAAPPPAPARVSLAQQPVVSTVCPSPAGPPPAAAPAPQGGNLDSMLVMLQSDLSRQGISTSTKGLCASCQKPIAGQVVTALGNTWHPEHFVCTHCQKEMGGSNFFEKDGAPYCERDYFQLFSPRCGLCNEPILDVTPRLLACFHEKDGQQYCHQDFYELFSTRCQGCGQAILENYISALSALWHPECFVCRECYAPFLQGSFFEHGGRPFCETHYHKQRGSLCWGCEKPIAGRCITAMARKFHPEHFVCAFCLKQLNKGTFKEQNDKPYCHPCFLKLFG